MNRPKHLLVVVLSTSALMGSLSRGDAAGSPLQFNGTDRVRVTAPLVRILPIEGMLVATAPDTLVVSETGRLFRIPLASVKQFQVFRESRSDGGAGIAGLILGVAAGGALGSLAAPKYTFAWQEVAVPVAGGAALGGIVGYVVGHGIGGHDDVHWETIPRTRLALELAGRQVQRRAALNH